MTSPISSSFKIVPFVENIFRMILRILIRFKSSAKPVYRKKKEWQCFCIGKNEKDALQKKERTLEYEHSIVGILRRRSLMAKDLIYNI